MFSLETLQFTQLLELLSQNAQTPMGERRLLELRPHSSRLKLDRDLRTIKETITLEKEDVSWSFSDLLEPTDSIALLKIENTSLEPKILREFARLLTQALFAKNEIKREKTLAPTLWEIVENLPSGLSKLADKINSKILPSGELDDSASPELNRLRREINSQRGRLTKTLEGLMHSKSNAVQDDIVTVRNDRFVIPVKANFSGKIKGVAHGASSSGATVFIEPMESIEANNELQILKAKEESEIARILFSLAEELRHQVPFIELAVEAIAELDFIKTKVAFARKFAAVAPTITNNNELDLTNARHPLLEESLNLANSSDPETDNEIVPISFSLSKQNSVMIISGANAGGKTVVLKTAGLLSLMAISGLPVPAEKARIPFYASVLADIGDHQSLSANLSTFSSHISNIASMMKNLHPPALVLLDEVGTGTDPEEGSALGVAIVDDFRQNNAQIIASTHYKGLKIYAANDEDVINASVEFNEKTLEPTYKLLTGIAGASSGIEIAKRFGIRNDVIEKARENLDVAAQKAEDYLHELQRETKRAKDLRIALEEEREATAEKYAKLDVEFRKKEKRRRNEFVNELTQTISEFEKQSREFLKSVTDKKERKKFEKEIFSQRSKLKRQTAKIENETKENRDGRKKPPKYKQTQISKPRVLNTPIEVGSQVLLNNFDKVGKVEKITGEVASIVVGSIRMNQSLGDLQAIESETTPIKKNLANTPRKTKRASIDLEVSDVQSELNLIGKTTLDAEMEVDKFLDQSYVSRLSNVRIIHGFGTGALKNSVHHFLRGHPHVSSFKFAPQNQGGNGATIVELKS